MLKVGILRSGMLSAVIVACALLAGAGSALAACTTTLHPGAELHSVLNAAKPGNVICLETGTYTATTWESGGGEAGKPVVLESATPKQPAVIEGRFVTDGTARWIEMRDLKFKGTTTQPLDDVVVLGTAHEQFVYNDVDGIGRHICINGVEYGGSKVEYSTIDHNTVHDCEGDELHSQGIYMLGGPGDLISNNWVWHVAARCFQIRGEKGTAAAPSKWLHNVCADSREGFIFGDLTPAYNIVEKNVVSIVVGNAAYTYGSVGSGNYFSENCISKQFGPENANVVLGLNLISYAEPFFVNAAAHDYSQLAGSPCLVVVGAGSEGRPGPGNEG
jgi:hypothetical protein